MGFERKYYNENEFPADVTVTRLGRIADGHYVKRLGRLMGAVRALRKVRTDYDAFYAFGLDCYCMARLAGFPKGIIEIGDLRAVDAGYAAKSVEKWVLKDAGAVVVTSPGFYDHYFQDNTHLPPEKGFVVENKVAVQLSCARPTEPLQCSKGRLRIGLVGLLRYQKPIELLLRFVRKHSDLVELHCFGDGPLKSLIQRSVCQNIAYHGSFKSPDDLPKIYASIDINYVVYDAQSDNVRLALPNKLYESAFFGVPILCAADTALNKVSKEWGIGMGIPLTDFSAFEMAFLRADKNWIQSASREALQIAPEDLLENDAPTIRKILNTVIKN